MYKKKLSFLSKILPLLKDPWIYFCIILSLFILGQWFNNGTILATAEEGLPFFQPSRTISLYHSLWVEIGFGSSSPFFIPRLPLYYFSYFLSVIHFPNLFIQEIIFFILICTPLLTFPKLVSYLFPEKSKIYGYLASLFYLFNLFTLSQVFERFIYPLMFLWSYLPLFLFFWIKYIDEKKIGYLLWLIISTFIFSDIFGLTSSFITLVVPMGLYFVYKIIFEKNRKITILYSIIGFIIWFLFQFWWIYPIWILRNDTYSAFLNPSANLISLKEVSQYFPTSQIIFLKQGYYFGDKNFLYGFYSQQTIQVLSIIIFLIVLIGLISLIKMKKWAYIFSLFLISWFISKGYNPPFGDVFYQFIFSKLSFTQILRNPYEKFGVVWLFPYSIFFSFGLFWLAERLKTWKVIFISLSLFLLLGYLVWPLWTGELFLLGGIKITAPTYYEDANKYLNSKDTHRILQLPLLQESSIQYTWGYRGEEPSEFLFDRSSLSRSDLGSPHDDFYLSFPKYLMKKNFTNILEVAGINGIVVHYDTIQNLFNQESLSDYESQIQTWKSISKQKNFGDLDVYTLNSKVDNWIYPVQKIYVAKTVIDGMNEMVKNNFNPYNSSVFIQAQNLQKFSFPKEMKLPKLSYVKESPTHYVVHITKATKPYVFVLSMTYDKLWTASIDKQTIDQHFEINGFANGWVVNKKGSYDINVAFKY